MFNQPQDSQAIGVEPQRDKIVVVLTARGRAQTVTPYPTGLYCKLSIGRIDGEHEQEVLAQTMEDLTPELYNTIFGTLEDDYTEFVDNLIKIGKQIEEAICI